MYPLSFASERTVLHVPVVYEAERRVRWRAVGGPVRASWSAQRRASVAGTALSSGVLAPRCRCEASGRWQTPGGWRLPVSVPR
jgi:hypothetical protein